MTLAGQDPVLALEKVPWWRALWVRVWSLQSVLRLVFLAVILGGWELTSIHLIKPIWISSPSRVGPRIVDAFGELMSHAGTTLQEALLGLAIGTMLGLLFGVLIARSPRSVRGAVDPFILAAYSIPRIALAPFFILWFGIGLASKVMLVVTVVSFAIFFNVRQGIEGLDRDLIDALRSMRATRFQMTRYVTVPAVVPWLLAGVKISVGLAVVSAIVGEIIGSTKGLGNYLTKSTNTFDMTGGFAAILMMSTMAMLLNGIVTVLERRLTSWQTPTGDAKDTTTKFAA